MLCPSYHRPPFSSSKCTASIPTLSEHCWLTLLCLFQNSETALVLYNIHIPFCNPAHLSAEAGPNLLPHPAPQGRDHHHPARLSAPCVLLAPAALQKLLWRWRSLRSPHTFQLRRKRKGFAVGRLRGSMEGAAGRHRPACSQSKSWVIMTVHLGD